MRNHTVRLYLATVTLFVFFALWATIAAKPWAVAAQQQADPRLLALTRWQHRLTRESVTVKRLVDRRWSVYEKQLATRRAQIRTAERVHAQQLAAARAAAARIAAAEAAAAQATRVRTVTTTTTTGVAAAPTPAAATPAAAPPPPSPKVVTLPPQVQIVTLPPATAPATSSSSSRP
jgi:hypothetical protein